MKTLTLTIKGLIPGKKNNKMLITRDPKGRPLKEPLLITKPEYQKRIAIIREDLESALLSAIRTESAVTLTEPALRSLIALLLPEDDCWTFLPEISLRGELCAPGDEGATITIERI